MGKVYSCGEFWRVGRGWRYTLVMSPIKIAGNGAKKNIPRDCHGMLNITGGDEGLPRSALPTLRCNRDDYTALCLCNLLVVEPGNCVAMSSYRPCISHNKNKTPKWAFDFCGGVLINDGIGYPIYRD